MTVQLPLFPVDDSTLDLLSAALDPREHGDPEAETSSVGPLLRMLGEMHGADYHDHDVLRALIAEVRRQRASHVEARIDREDDLWIEINGRWCCFLAGGARHRGLDALEEEFGPTSAVTIDVLREQVSGS